MGSAAQMRDRPRLSDMSEQTRFYGVCPAIVVHIGRSRVVLAASVAGKNGLFKLLDRVASTEPVLKAGSGGFKSQAQTAESLFLSGEAEGLVFGKPLNTESIGKCIKLCDDRGNVAMSQTADGKE